MGPHVSEEEAESIHELANQGVKINYRLWWWEEPGITHHNALDIFYNETFRQQVEGVIDYNFDLLNPEKLWAVTLSDEEPGWSYHDWYDMGTLPYVITPDVAIYGDVYNAETGLQLKTYNDMNDTEQVIFWEWINEKTVWVFNHLYDYVKSKWPHLQVFQFMAMAPFAYGSPGAACEPYELKADGFYLAYFPPSSLEGLYDTIRRYKTVFPNKEFHIALWGREWPPGSQGGFTQISRYAWVAYLAGADAVGWFTCHLEEHGWGPRREDPFGKRLYMYTNRLNKELEKLPVLKPDPQVLAISGGTHPGRNPGVDFAELNAFTEYDAVSQRFFAKADMNLSKYKLIAFTEWKFYEETVLKLNEYVENGGNLIFLGSPNWSPGTVWSPNNILSNETRKNKFLIEENTVQSTITGHIRTNITKPNMLDMEMEYDGQLHETLALRVDSLDENYHPIGDFYLIEEDGATRKITDHPLVLYHNKSNPDSGWILFWGALHSSRTPDVTWETYWEDFSYADIRFLHREILRAFANYLNISGSVSTAETENVLITQSELEDGTILAGLSNLNLETKRITYSLDLSRLGRPDGEYWVHSLDENATLGLFESRASRIEFSVELAANGTKLFLISQDKPEPAYSVEIFPKIPSAEDIPSASFTYSPADPSTEDTVNFADTSTDSDGTIVFRYWEFGDGTTSTEQNPSHQYGNMGEYTIMLTVTDNDGGRNTVEQAVTILSKPDYTICVVIGGLIAALSAVVIFKTMRRRKMSIDRLTRSIES